MKVVFVTVYNESARGTRNVAAAVEAAGHSVSFIHFKRWESVAIPRNEPERIEQAIAHAPFQVREVTAAGECFHPYHTTVTERERRLFAELIDELRPDVLGITFATHAYPLARQLTELARETRPGVPIVWGGIHAIVDPDACIRDADVVCPGEGEECFVEYLADPGRTDIAGLWFRSGNGPIMNPLRPLLQDLDLLPWPIYGGDEYEIDRDRIGRRMSEDAPFIRLNFYSETSRGCPFACSYCIHSISRDRYAGQKYLRWRSLENVMEEIKAFRQRFGGLQAVMPFFDEILLMNKKRFARFAELYRREIDHPFCGFAHHRTTDREMLTIAREAGIAETSIGLQTGSEWLAREIYNRPIDREAIIGLARDIAETGAGRLIVNVLCDCTFEREEDLQATFDILLQMPRPYLLQLSRVVPFPKTALAEMKCDVPALPQRLREFWNYLYLLTQSDRIEINTLKKLATDRDLVEMPETLDALAGAILAAPIKK